jgi:hypothetical protein
MVDADAGILVLWVVREGGRLEVMGYEIRCLGGLVRMRCWRRLLRVVV